jgi:ABC-type nitrate/sulfonate/bicarbonate transport system substrate-binding protein
MVRKLPSLLGTALSVWAVGCATAASPEPPESPPPTALRQVYFQLDWIYNAQFAGLYQAIEQGYFAEAGLAVTLAEAPKSRGVVEAVVAHPGIAFGSSESNVLLGKFADGLPVVALTAMFQQSPMGWMYLKTPDRETLADFAGARVGIHGDGEKVLRIALAQAGMTLDDVRMTEVGYDPAIVANGEIDLMQGYVIDEFVKLQQLVGEDAGVLMAKDYGYLAASQVIFTRADLAAQEPELVAAFLEACRRGWEYALAHPEETIDLLLREWNPDLDRAYQRQSLALMTPLVKAADGSLLAPMDRGEWEASMAMFVEHELLPAPIDLAGFVPQP